MADLQQMYRIHALQRTNTALSWQSAMNDSEMAKPKADAMIAQNNMAMHQAQREMALKAMMMEKELYEKQVGWNIQTTPEEDSVTRQHATQAQDALNRFDEVRNNPDAAGPVASALEGWYAQHLKMLPQADTTGSLKHRASMAVSRTLLQLGKRPMDEDAVKKFRDAQFPVGGSKELLDASVQQARNEVRSRLNSIAESQAQRRASVFGGQPLQPQADPFRNFQPK